MNLGRFRKRPIEVEAMLVEKTTAPVVADWCGGYLEQYDDDLWIDVPTLEGMLAARLGDWVIRGVHGEFYPCKPDIFEETYERVSPLVVGG